MMYSSSVISYKKDFIKFALGFVGMISLGFTFLVIVGFYQVEFSGTTRATPVEFGLK